MTIWTLGDAVVDLLPLAGMQFEACAGGAPVNVAAGAARLGQNSGFIGRVGNDTFGHFLRRTLEEYGVNIARMQFDDEHHTSTVLVSLDKQGDRQFGFLVNPSADQFLTTDALPEFGADILHFCSLALVATPCRHTLEQAMAGVRNAGGILSFDLNVREQMWPQGSDIYGAIGAFSRQADVLKMSEEEWFGLTGSVDFTTALRRLEAWPARLKIVTFGAQGALVCWQKQVFHFAGYRVESIDTTGAGDAFMAGLLSALSSKGWPQNPHELLAMMSQASACGALATTQKGALNATPDSKQRDAFIAAHPPLDVEQQG